MKRIINIISLLVLSAGLYGQSLPFLNISSDPYSYSMGGNTLTLEPTAYSVTSNASAMALSENVLSASATYMAWQPNVLNNQMLGVAGYYRADKLAVGISGKYYTHTPYDITDDNGYVSGMFTPVEMSADVAVAYRLFGGLSVGANVRYITSSMTETNAGNAVSADISVSYKLKNIKVAVAVTNIGSEVDYGYGPYKLPSMAKAGAGYTHSINKNNSVSIHVEGDYLLNKSAFMAALGAEYSFKKLLSLRVGYHYGDNNSIPSYASAGLGINILGINVSGAYVLGFNNSPINGSYMLSLGYSF